MVTKYKIKCLSILILSIVLTLIFNLLIKTNKDEYNNTREIYTKMRSNLDHKEKYFSAIEKLSKQSHLYISKNYYQEDIISILYGYADINDVNISTMSFEEETKTALDKSSIEINNEFIELGLEKEYTTSTSFIGMIGVSIEFTCNLENVLYFIDDIKNDGASISVNSLRYIPVSDDLISGVLNIKFYTVP